VRSRAVTSGPGAASGRGRKFARGLCGQYSPLPFLPAARTVSMEWQRPSCAAPGKPALASAPGWFCPTAATRDWSRGVHRRACMQLVRHRCLEVSLLPPAAARPCTAEVILSRRQRAHYRLSWQEQLARPCARFNSWASDDQTVWCPRKLGHLAREGSGLTSS